MRNLTFTIGEYYHIYNRGTDKRNIFSNIQDLERFIQSMHEFNVVKPIGSIYEHSFTKKETSPQLGSRASKLVDFVCYCINPNHYHFLLVPLVDKGIEKFMHRLGTGYTKYFNTQQKRSGVLFQGKFKAIHIRSNNYLLHVSTYINLNNKVHQLGSSASKLVCSSWEEYLTGSKGVIPCEKDVILRQFGSIEEYQKFAESSLESIVKRKTEEKEMQSLCIE